MKKGILSLFLLTLASQGSWCAAERSPRISADRRVRPRLQVQELYGKKDLEIQSPRKLGHGQSLTQHEASAVEMKHPRRMAIGHRGGSVGGGGTSVGGGGGSAARPHNTKNGAAALLVPATTSFLTLAFTCGVVLSAFSF
ncbi:uncharacterized protein LOC133895904 [Phragmites australis]|uniref:uncharacterized protein LOC133895904 n=1 Tax=Phragmites australis TaxID=29695 RepID=UPI002D7A0B78|nr:uncharacterized protein LOC133895904 [Phragmites australis]